MHLAAICISVVSAVSDVPRPQVEASTPVLVEIRTLDGRLVGFAMRFDAILRCVMVGDDETLARLLKEGHALNPPSAGGWTVLHYAVFQGTLRTVTLLVEHGADVNARSDDGPTPLELAQDRAERDPTRRDIVNILQKHGAK